MSFDIALRSYSISASPRTRGAASAAAAWLFLSGAALAQSFNVDYGSSTPAPSASYGAAAEQPGPWNAITGLEDRAVALVDVAGQQTAVTINPDLPFGPAAFNHPGTSGDAEALLDDYLDLHSVPAAFHVDGLQPGTYVVYTYAWAPDEAAFKTFVTVNGADTQIVGGKWPGGLRKSITHAVHVAGIAEGESLDIQTFGLGKGTLNGLQLVRMDTAFTDLGGGLEGESGRPEFFGQGALTAGTPVTLTISRAALLTPVTLVAGFARVDLPFKGGVLVPSPDLILSLGTTSEEGTLTLVTTWPASAPSQTELFLQCWLPDAAAIQGVAASNALKLSVP